MTRVLRIAVLEALRDLVRHPIDVLLHRIPRSGDRIRLHRRLSKPKGSPPYDRPWQWIEFIGEFYIKIKDGAVFVLDNSGRNYIRRDLPRWSGRFSCWTYCFDS